MEERSTGTLSMVGVPIGNLADITLRALETLRNATVVLAEDTRVTRKLLSHYEISVPVESLHAHSGAGAFSRAVERLQAGERIAYVTDAGTPGISDPGGALVATVRREAPDVVVEAIPGASSVTAALSIAGVYSTEFMFYGFFPRKKGRNSMMEEITTHDDRVAVFFESTHRIVKTLELFAAHEALSKRRIVVCKEITKMHERVIEGTPHEVLAVMAADQNLSRGEFVVVIDRVGRGVDHSDSQGEE